MTPRAHEHDENCAPKPGDVLCIVWGPTKVLRTVDAGERWCFGCRQRLPHTDTLLADEEPSYYEPVWVRRCSRCSKDRTDFPGGEPW